MIYYFSGSGNSRAVARHLGSMVEQPSSLIPNPIGNMPPLEIHNGTVGIVAPVYSWGIPPKMLRWIQDVEIRKIPEYLWVVLTYGDEAGHAHLMLEKALSRRGLRANVIFGLQMPNTYVLLPGFNVDSHTLAQQKLQHVEQLLPSIADAIHRRASDSSLSPVHVGSIPRLKTHLIYPIFRAAGINPSKWRVMYEKCIGCQVCAAACPVHNIRMEGAHPSHPVWGSDCTSCLACYHACPSHAVEYGRLTHHKGQWRHWFKHK